MFSEVGSMDIMDTVNVKVLVVKSKLLGFNLFLGMDIIKELGGVHITNSDNALSYNMQVANLCSTKIDKPYFSAEFHQDMKMVSWPITRETVEHGA